MAAPLCQSCGDRPATTTIDNRGESVPGSPVCAQCYAGECAYIRAHFTRDEQDQCFPWMADGDKSPIDPIDPGSVRGRLAAHGFKLENTGGNCSAYVRISDDGEIEELIVRDTDPIAPDDDDDRCLVSTRSLIDEPGKARQIEREVSDVATLGHIFALLADTENEYALLGLRIANEPDPRANECPECARSYGPNYSGPCEHN